MFFKHVLLITALTFGTQSALAHDYKPRPEPMKYRLSDETRKAIDGARDEVQVLQRQLFVFIDGTCQNPFVPCNCTFEGFSASCDFVLACLGSGLCVPDN